MGVAELSLMKEKMPNEPLFVITWISLKVIDQKGAVHSFPKEIFYDSKSDIFFRYFELVSIHGKLDPLVNVDLRPEKRVKVTFTCGNNSEVRSVDVYRTVSDLKTKLEAFAGFSATSMRLFYVDQDLRDQQVSVCILLTLNSRIYFFRAPKKCVTLINNCIVIILAQETKLL